MTKPMTPHEERLCEMGINMGNEWISQAFTEEMESGPEQAVVDYIRVLKVACIHTLAKLEAHLMGVGIEHICENIREAHKVQLERRSEVEREMTTSDPAYN